MKSLRITEFLFFYAFLAMPAKAAELLPNLTAGRRIETCYTGRTDRFSGGYFPARLGGLRQTPEIWVRFKEIINPKVERENEARGRLNWEPLSFSEFCGTNDKGFSTLNSLSVDCEAAMDQAYQEAVKVGAAEVSMTKKWIELLNQKKLSLLTAIRLQTSKNFNPKLAIARLGGRGFAICNL